LGDANRAEVRVLDRPAISLDRRHGDVERRGVAFPRHDERADAAGRARVLLDGAGHIARRSGYWELCQSQKFRNKIRTRKASSQTRESPCAVPIVIRVCARPIDFRHAAAASSTFYFS